MNNEITIAIIGAGASILASVMTLIGVLANQKQSNNKIMHQIEVHQAVTDTKIDELTREVREHNDFARRVPVAENNIEELKRIANELKRYHMQ